VIERLRQRRDFLKAQKGRRASTGLFSVLALRKAEGPARIGFTVSKKVDVRAVKRNRIRRRLKEAARLEGAALIGVPADIVVIARPDALTAAFSRLRSDLRKASAKALGMDGQTTEQSAAPQRGE
jgi:ribonuclease P protein component